MIPWGWAGLGWLGWAGWAGLGWLGCGDVGGQNSSDHDGNVAGAATHPGTLTAHWAWETEALDCVGLLLDFDFGFNYT